MPDSLPVAFWPILAFLVLVPAVVIFASRGQKSARQNPGNSDGGYPYAPGTSSDGGCGSDSGGGGCD
ncbi:MAG: hypothetical protein ACKVS5_08435 [Parvularculaceae bacterium]